MIDPDEYEFDWQIIKIVNEKKKGGKRGAMVLYTPCNDIEGCTPIEQWVPIPWHKCTDADHAKTVCRTKVLAYAPRREWQKEMTPEPDDKSTEIIEELENGEPERGEVRTDATGDSSESTVSE